MEEFETNRSPVKTIIMNAVRRYDRIDSFRDQSTTIREITQRLNAHFNKNNIRRNFLIFNEELEYRQNLNQAKFFWTFQLGTTTYAMWIFKSGTFQNIDTDRRDTAEIWSMGGYNGGRYKVEGPIVSYILRLLSCGLIGRRVWFYFPQNWKNQQRK